MSKKPEQLKAKLEAARKELASLEQEIKTLNRVAVVKQSQLTSLQTQLDTANKELEDGFSHKKLQLERSHIAYRDSILLDVETIGVEVTRLENRKGALQKDCDKASALLHDTQTQVIEERTKLSFTQSQTVTQQKVVTDLTSRLNGLKTAVRESETVKHNLDSELADKKTAYKADLTTMVNSVNIEKTRILEQTEVAREELATVKEEIQTQKTQLETTAKADKDRENRLIARENAVVVKTKALQKEQLEFNQEQRYFRQELKQYVPE